MSQQEVPNRNLVFNPIASTSSASTILAIASASVRPIRSYASPYSQHVPPYSTDSSHHSHELNIAGYLETVFCPAVEPTVEEYSAKEDARQYLEVLTDRVSPGAKLLPFGSMANGFALRNSDMDLCCFADKEARGRTAAELVEILGAIIAEETNYHVKMLPRARIPIIKLSMPPSELLPFGMACDIGFENRLALENTRLLLTYAKIDERLRTMVLFLKVWTKRRQINNPYRGTLSSYGYVLLVIYYLGHVKQPTVLPNLQRLKSQYSLDSDTAKYDGHDISFFDDLDALKAVWSSNNTDNVGDLLIDFFRFFAKEFSYSNQVISIRSETGVLSKDSKGWPNDPEYDAEYIIRDQHKLCIEDPFQLDYNVARTVTRDGLYTIRGEFIRAHRIFASRSYDRVSSMINEVCEEREDYIAHHPPPFAHSYPHSPRRQSAPSPRLLSTKLPPPLPLPGSITEFRAWANINGVHRDAFTNGQPDALSLPTQRGHSPSFSSFLSTSAHQSSTSAQSPDPKSIPASHQYQQQYQQQQPHHQPQSHSQNFRSLSLSPSQPPLTLNATIYQNRSPTPGSLERRTSWDGTAPNALMTAGGNYDVHRLFQDHSNDIELPPTSPASSPASLPHLPSNSAANLETNQFPTLTSTSNYRLEQYQHTESVSPYQPSAYLLSPLPVSLDGRLQPQPPFLQRPHQWNSSHPSQQTSTGQHYFTNPSTSPIPETSSLPRNYHSSNYRSPAPIFPEADREAIVLANSITFGNFGSNPGIYSYGSMLHSASSTTASATPSPTFNRSNNSLPVRSESGTKFDSRSDSTEEACLTWGTSRGADRRGRRDAEVPRGTSNDEEIDTLELKQRRRGRSVPMRLDYDSRDIAMLKFGQVETEFFMPREEIYKVTEGRDKLEAVAATATNFSAFNATDSRSESTATMSVTDSRSRTISTPTDVNSSLPSISPSMKPTSTFSSSPPPVSIRSIPSTPPVNFPANTNLPAEGIPLVVIHAGTADSASKLSPAGPMLAPVSKVALSFASAVKSAAISNYPTSTVVSSDAGIVSASNVKCSSGVMRLERKRGAASGKKLTCVAPAKSRAVTLKLGGSVEPKISER